ncbi:MAG: phage DNA packaging protein J [Pirellulales bacterium]|nr:phage DNA packaging protein J [Pirellulales bacterium]
MVELFQREGNPRPGRPEELSGGASSRQGARLVSFG